MCTVDQGCGHGTLCCYSNTCQSNVCVAPEGATGGFTVKILKIGTPEIITIIVLQLEQLDFIVQYCVQKMQTE